jgi:hypothetical protein
MILEVVEGIVPVQAFPSTIPLKFSWRKAWAKEKSPSKRATHILVKTTIIPQSLLDETYYIYMFTLYHSIGHLSTQSYYTEGGF